MSSDQSASKKKFIPPTPEELSPLFPAYDITDFIAAGGMGAVYRAKQKSLDRDVAIKILPREFGADQQFRENFEAEAKAMAKLNHPNLMAVYDFGDVNGMLFIAMEFVKGKALYYSAHRKQIDPITAFKMISRIAKGVAHAHDNGILHRDLKPANILLLPDATPKVGDFGLARSVDSRGVRERTVFGTPGYTAPEVYSKKYPVDQRSDIFSIGAMLCELLTGELPKPNSSYMVTGIDPRFDNITRKATHPVPEQRHRDTHELIKEIKELLPKLENATSPTRLKTGLSSTGQITTHVNVRVTAPLTQPMVSGPLTQAAITQPHALGAMPGKKKSGISSLIALVGVGAVAAVIYFVISNKQTATTIAQPPPLPNTNTPSGTGAGATTVSPSNNSSSAPKAQLVHSDGRTYHQIASTAINGIRNQIQIDSRPYYSRFQRGDHRFIRTFDRATQQEVKTLSPAQKKQFNELLTQSRRTNIFPNNLPSGFPDSMKTKLREARKQQTIFRREERHAKPFNQARASYFAALDQEAEKFRKNSLDYVVKLIEQEKGLISADENRLHAILRGNYPEIPQ